MCKGGKNKEKTSRPHEDKPHVCASKAGYTMMANCFGIKCLCPHQLENPDNFVPAQGDKHIMNTFRDSSDLTVKSTT